MTISSLLLLTASVAFACATVPFWHWDYQPHRIGVGQVLLILSGMEIIWLGVNLFGYLSLEISNPRIQGWGTIIQVVFVLMMFVQFAFALQVVKNVGIALAG